MMNNQLNGKGMEPVDARWNAQETVRNFTESVHPGLKTQQLSQPMNVQKEGQPSNVLWIGYPPSVHVDEQMLYRAMILFGEIEKIKVFPSRFYSFVEFRSIDEARRAKEGLQGRLFNDPRITINYSSSELSPGGDHTSFYPAVKGQRPDGLVNDNPLRSAQMDALSHSRLMAPNMLPHPSPKKGMEPELSDLANSALMGPVWRRPPPPPHGLLPLTSGIGPTNRPKSSTWDVLDANQFQQDPKRPRMDGGFPLEQPDRLEMPPEQAVSGSPAVFPGRNRLSPADARVVVGPVQGRSVDYIWRGIIAKGGSTVCHARCIPIGKGLESQLSGAVNCSARTGLEMLAKHFADAIGFDIVFFLPDSEDDFAPYTEFLRYLGDKNRAGVAKLADGTTLFLVPPSEFLTEVLKVLGPERLYGVVLKMPEHLSDRAQMLHPSPHSIHPSQYVGRQLAPQYNPVTQEGQRPPLDYERVPSINTQIDPKTVHETPADNHATYAAPHDYPSTNVPSSSSLSYPSNVTLTPELVATLASLIPPNSRPSEFSNPPAITAPVWKQEYGGAGQAGMGVPPQWKHEYAASEQTAPADFLHPQMGNQANHSGNQLIQQAQHPTVHHNYLAVPGSQMQDPAFDRPQPAAISHQSVPDFTSSSGSGHFPALQQPGQHYQLEGQGPSGFYGLPALQQSGGHMILPQAQVLMPSVANKENLETANQVQQLHSVLYGANQGAAENEGDKNQRYQSTLQFAANLLLQIRQKQQQQQQQQQSQTEQGVGDTQ